MTTLAELNELRIRNGKAPLKTWKESKAKLAAAIEKETPNAASNKRIAKNPDLAKMVKQEVAKTANVAAKHVDKHVNVAAIAKELGINAKVARAKLRKLKIDRNDAKAIRKTLAKK